MKKVILYILFASAALWGATKVYHHLYYRYFLTDLYLGYPLQPIAIPEPTTDESKLLDIARYQPYYYLDQGAQSYAFLSEDGEYVLKIFHYKHTLDESKKDQLNATLNGYRLAYDKIKELSGILYLHLNPTDKELYSIRLTDRMGFHHTIDLSKVRFVIQKKVKSADSIFKYLIQTKQFAAVQKKLDKINSAIHFECSKNLVDQDPAILQNFGFDESDELVHYDLGKLEENVEICGNSALFNAHITKINQKLSNWLKNNSFTDKLNLIIN